MLYISTYLPPNAAYTVYCEISGEMAFANHFISLKNSFGNSQHWLISFKMDK